MWKSWFRVNSYVVSLGPELLQQMGIAAGAAITGLVGIVFVVTLFAIQQAADRGTAAMLEEFSKDRALWGIYLSLAVLALASFVLAFVPWEPATRLYVHLGLVALAFLLLRIQFRRAVELVSARGLIARYHRRARRRLEQIKKLEDLFVRAELLHPSDD